jgi:hypothetical protein
VTFFIGTTAANARGVECRVRPIANAESLDLVDGINDA